MFKKMISAILASVAVMLTLTGCTVEKSSDAEHMYLRLGHNLQVSHPGHKSLVEFSRLVSEKTNGRIEIDIFPGEILGGQKDMVELTQTGAIDLIIANPSTLEMFEPSYQLLNLPYMFESEEHFFNVMDDRELMSQLYEATIPSGLRGLTYYGSGARSFYTVDKPIRRIEDMKGLKIRVQTSPTQVEMVRLMGAAPTPMNFGDIYTALQQKVIDGAESNETVLTTSNHGEVAKYFCNNRHTMIPDILIINEKLYQNLSEEDRAVLLEAAIESTEFHKVGWQQEVDDAKKVAIEEMGVTFVEIEDIQPFIDAVQPIHDEVLKDSELADLYAQIKAKK